MLIESTTKKIYSAFIKEYFAFDFFSSAPEAPNFAPVTSQINVELSPNYSTIAQFLKTPCPCSNNCQSQFSADEILNTHKDLRQLAWNEKNCFILSQLHAAVNTTNYSVSGRKQFDRVRQKYSYRVNSNREVCRDVFLFYYNETISRLKYLQKHLTEVGISLPEHGNIGKQPKHACSEEQINCITSFIYNFAIAHAMPDPGRDVRKGKGQLRMFLPAILNYTSVYRMFQKSSSQDISYRTFIRVWHDVSPNVCFSKPRSDLCMICEDYKKQLYQLTSDLTEESDAAKVVVYNEALEHIELARKERQHYQNRVELCEKHFNAISSSKIKGIFSKGVPKSMHYSWDFAQQLFYPFEAQQVGPIYFKIPRRAQLFGVCCEGASQQINYLIDEADFPDKGANTVISLLDHFFSHYSFKEKQVFLTADNCVAQNKNNALLHYLIYRTLTGLHDKISLSFMVVGHTKFAPDGYFGLIKKKYRHSSVYTYEQLATIIEQSSQNNKCHRYYNKDAKNPIVYRDWSPWLAEYFNPLPNITTYRHFLIDKKDQGVVTVKTSVDGKKSKHVLLKKNLPTGTRGLPQSINAEGLPNDRAWYLYEKIREHIPNDIDKDITCPKPIQPKQKKVKVRV